MFELRFDAAPSRLYTVQREYEAAATPARTPNSNFLRGVKWSPDGACLLTASDDNCLRIYDTPLEAFQLVAPSPGAEHDAADGAEQQLAGQRVPAQPPAQPQGDSFAPALRIQDGELLYDFCWYSCMSAADPALCCLATTGRGQPTHLWDALTGELRCTYRAYNDLDEVAPAHSLAFDAHGAMLYCGFDRGTVRAFRVDRPGRDCITVAAYRKGGEGLPGIVSCLAPNPDRTGMLAAGSYSGSAALMDPRTRELLCLLEGGHAGGVTHLCFSADGNFLYTGARRDTTIRCWDVRYASGVVYSLERASGGTNQRMTFDVEPCGRHLATGGEDGLVRTFDLRDGSAAGQFAAADDTVNGVAFHPFLPLLATASGQRRFFLTPADNSEDDSSSGSDSDSPQPASAAWPLLEPGENVLRVWQCAAHELPAPAEPEAPVGAEQQPEAGAEGGQDGDEAMQDVVS